MELDVQRSGTGSTIKVSGELDVHSAYEMYRAATVEAEHGSRRVALDLAGVTFIDSVGLSLLIRTRDDLVNDYESRLVLRNPSDRAARLLSLTALTNQFEYDT